MIFYNCIKNTESIVFSTLQHAYDTKYYKTVVKRNIDLSLKQFQINQMKTFNFANSHLL